MSKPEYELIIKNDSQTNGYAMIFCEKPDVSEPDLLTYVWQTKFLYSGVQASLKWQIDWGFMWRQINSVNASQQIVPANLETSNKIQLAYDSEHQAFHFLEPTNGEQPGSILISTEPTVPVNMAEVGLALAGNPAFLVKALPNMNYIFTPKLAYWLVFGETNETGPVDVSAYTNAVAINFPANIYSLTATIQKDGTITLENTPLVLAEQVE